MIRKIKTLVRDYLFFSTDKFLTDFEKSFPSKCPICSFHRYGLSHGYDMKPVKKHKCIDAPPATRETE